MEALHEFRPDPHDRPGIEWSRILAQDFFTNIIELKRFN